MGRKQRRAHNTVILRGHFYVLQGCELEENEAEAVQGTQHCDSKEAGGGLQRQWGYNRAIHRRQGPEQHWGHDCLNLKKQM